MGSYVAGPDRYSGKGDNPLFGVSGDTEFGGREGALPVVPRVPGGSGENGAAPAGRLSSAAGTDGGLTVSERARVMRQVGASDTDMSAAPSLGDVGLTLLQKKYLTPEQKAFQADVAVAAERARLNSETVGYANDAGGMSTEVGNS